jgi:hypothetical protein
MANRHHSPYVIDTRRAESAGKLCRTLARWKHKCQRDSRRQGERRHSQPPSTHAACLAQRMRRIIRKHPRPHGPCDRFSSGRIRHVGRERLGCFEDPIGRVRHRCACFATRGQQGKRLDCGIGYARRGLGCWIHPSGRRRVLGKTRVFEFTLRFKDARYAFLSSWDGKDMGSLKAAPTAYRERPTSPRHGYLRGYLFVHVRLAGRALDAGASQHHRERDSRGQVQALVLHHGVLHRSPLHLDGVGSVRSNPSQTSSGTAQITSVKCTNDPSGVRGVVRGVRVAHVQDKQLGVARPRRIGGRLDGQVRRRRRVRSHQDLAPSVVASFVHGTVCPEATSGDGARTFLVMGCRHAP